MFNDATGHEFKKIFLCVQPVDMRKGIDGLASVILTRFDMDPYDRGVLFLFIGRRKDRLKALEWEGDGWCLLTKRLSCGRFQWPHNEEELKDLTPEQYRSFVTGLSIECTIKEIHPRHVG